MASRPQHTVVYRRLCKLLRQWREEAGLTQRDLAKLLKKPHTYVHKTEVGDRRIDPIELVRWAIACGLDPQDALQSVADLC